MARATPEDIECFLGCDVQDSQLQCYIDLASGIVDQVEACANTTDERLKQAEIQLTLHFLANAGLGCLTAGAVKAESIDSQSMTYAVSDNMNSGLLSTQYGQIANYYLNGCLKRLDDDASKETAGVIFTGGA